MLKETITSIGARQVASKCEVSIRAVYKWCEKGVLPRTDFTGETRYAEIISELSLSTDSSVTKEQLLQLPR